MIVYALLVAFGLRDIPPNLLLPLASGSLLPIALFFAGMMLPALAAPNSSAHEQAQPDEITPHARVLRWLVIAALVGSFALALFVVGVAHVLGITLVLLLTWDSRGMLWRTLLGPVRTAGAAAASRWSLLWRGLFALVAFGTPLLMVELALVWSRSTLAAVGVALLWAAVARRRYGALFFAALLVLPVIAVVPYGVASWGRHRPLPTLSSTALPGKPSSQTQSPRRSVVACTSAISRQRSARIIS